MLTYEQKAFQKRKNEIKGRVIKSRSDQSIKGYYQVGKGITKSYLPKGIKKRRLYGLFSNAAEMSSEKGIAYGMTNLNFDPEGDPMVKTKYDGSSKWVGFRCVAEYVKK